MNAVTMAARTDHNYKIYYESEVFDFWARISPICPKFEQLLKMKAFCHSLEFLNPLLTV